MHNGHTIILSIIILFYIILYYVERNNLMDMIYTYTLYTWSMTLWSLSEDNCISVHLCSTTGTCGVTFGIQVWTGKALLWLWSVITMYTLYVYMSQRVMLDVCHDAGVDVALWGHEHIYERLWPVYNRKVRLFITCVYSVLPHTHILPQVMNGSYDSPYTNPRAPVHIITGSAVSYYVYVNRIGLQMLHADKIYLFLWLTIGMHVQSELCCYKYFFPLIQ